MFHVSDDAQVKTSLLPDGLLERLTDEYAAEGAQPTAVSACVRTAVHAVRYFGEDPAGQALLVERIARNELDILVGRDTDRARM